MVKKLIPKFIALIVTFLVITFLFLGFQIKSFSKTAKPVKSDCIIVLGCSVYGKYPSPFLAARAEEGLRLYNNGYAKKIIVSGGQGKGEDISEALAMKNYLLSKGVVNKDIIVEDKSTSTKENIKNSKLIMEDMGFKNCIIVSNKFHLKRAYLISKRLNIHSSFSGVYVSKYKSVEFKSFLREILALTKCYLVK